MNAIVICPEYRVAAGLFHRMKPLALMPVLGRSLLDRALSRLAGCGVREVILLNSDRPDMIREAVGSGIKWGLKLQVIATATELTEEEAHARFASQFPSPPQVIVLDHLPDGDSTNGGEFWRTHFENFSVLRQAIGQEKTASGLTMREVSAGVWVSTKARVSDRATLDGPLWIGPHVTVKPGARIGPGTILEAGVFIDRNAELASCWIGPQTYIGEGMAIHQSFAWGNGLLNWQNGSFLEVQDSFFIQDINRRAAPGSRTALIERLAALVLLLITAPVALVIALSSLTKKRSVFQDRRVLRPPFGCLSAYTRTFRLRQLNGPGGLWQRWPELWNVVRGEMALTGNRPLSPEAATALRGETGQLWFADPCGVFSLSDAAGSDPLQMPDALAHAAWFSVQRNFALRLRILLQCLGRLLFPQPSSHSPAISALP